MRCNTWLYLTSLSPTLAVGLALLSHLDECPKCRAREAGSNGPQCLELSKQK